MDTNSYVPEDETEISHNYHSGSGICTRVVGVTFCNRQAVVSRLTIGEEVILRRETNNAYDHNAIRVERLNGQQFGYINRYLATTLAPFFDSSPLPVIAKVRCVTGCQFSGYSLGVVIAFSIP